MKQKLVTFLSFIIIILIGCSLPSDDPSNSSAGTMTGTPKEIIQDDFPSGTSYAGDGQIFITYADLDNDPTTGVEVSGTWYPNETQIALFVTEGYVDTNVFGYPDYICFFPNYPASVTASFVIQFIDVTAPGWVYDDPSTWTERYINEAHYDLSTDGATAEPTPYIGIRAYRNFGQDTLVDENINGVHTLESASGFSELIVRTYYAENCLELLDVYVTGGQNTPSGSDVSFTENNVTVTFDNVTVPGDTSVVQTSTGTAPAPDIYVGSPPVYYNIETTAEYEGDILICVNYDESLVVGDEADLQLFHLVTICDISGCEDIWQDVTVSVDTDANIICGRVSHLSEFLLGSQTPPTTTDTVLEPTIGTIGTEICITGEGFGDNPGLVMIDKWRTCIIEWTDTQIKVEHVHQLIPGEYTVEVIPDEKSGLPEQTLAQSFTIVPPELAFIESEGDTGPYYIGRLTVFFGEYWGDEESELSLYIWSREKKWLKWKVDVAWGMDPKTGDSSGMFSVPNIPVGVYDIRLRNLIGWSENYEAAIEIIELPFP